MRTLNSTLLRTLLVAGLLCPLNSDAGLFDFLRGNKEADSSGLDAQEVAARAMFKNARQRESDGRHEAAREIHENIVELYPATSIAAESQFKIGELYELEKKDSKAFDAYDDLIKNYKESPLYMRAVEREFDIAERAVDGKAENFLGIGYKAQPSRLIEMFTAITKNAPYSKYAPLSQYAIGDIYAEDDRVSEAIGAYQKVVAEYPTNKKAAEAQFRIGELLTADSKKGNNDRAHLRKTREAYEEFLIQFPKDDLARVAMEQLDEIQAQEVTKAFEIAQFYEKSGKLKAAAIYYEEVLKHPAAAEYDDARARMDFIGERGDLKIGSLDLTPKVVAVPAKFDVKGRSDYLGPPAPKLASASSRRSMRAAMDDFKPVPVEEPDLPEPAPPTTETGSPSPIQSLLPPLSPPQPQSPFQTLLPPASPTPSLLGTPSSPTLTIDPSPSPSPITISPSPIPAPPSPFSSPRPTEESAPEEIKVIKSTEE